MVATKAANKGVKEEDAAGCVARQGHSRITAANFNDAARRQQGGKDLCAESVMVFLEAATFDVFMSFPRTQPPEFCSVEMEEAMFADQVFLLLQAHDDGVGGHSDGHHRPRTRPR